MRTFSGGSEKVYATKGFSHDSCYVCLEDNRNSLASNITDIPLLSVSKEKVSKIGRFSKQALDAKFKNAIPITSHMVEPLSYYPFSSTDDRSVIIPYVMRAIITLLLDRKRRGAKIFDPATYRDDSIMRTVHKMWDVISLEEQRALHQTTHEILDSEYNIPSFINKYLKFKTTRLLRWLQYQT